MTPKEAAYILWKHNEWRIGKSDIEMPPPALITEALNVAIEALDHLPDAGKKVGINNCPTCNGYGYTAEHDPMSTDEIGQHDCFGCPIQVQCEDCMGTGRVNNIPDTGKKVEPDDLDDLAKQYLTNHPIQRPTDKEDAEYIAVKLMSGFAEQILKEATR